MTINLLWRQQLVAVLFVLGPGELIESDSKAWGEVTKKNCEESQRGIRRYMTGHNLRTEEETIFGLGLIDWLPSTLSLP